ncbi:putative phosphoribosylaminoimidazolecarboxamide formyltransferase/IMP cyclohydrolase [Streptomyces turgidiscabies Car8]|uniref:Putative phosphoribosylaminoimidazolecarboxamide formyltransferase/IMP cyclohydrolase n=1 Tax=Streptomyces turgidiscabies (strain Car8) TaxID=698760 RepID=L7EQZ6_STRT8|nr:putative phosphoribosylaminoimidazolecarboxamide formyltransferase/IMP cyclohydrolase [Streptomyces turgidiscabies Car8]
MTADITVTAESNKRALRRALVSVYDKTGLEELARGLHEAGVELVSTGSTAGRIAAAGVPVTKVEELTGFPECLDGRVKTLHPKVHAGILADLRLEDHRTQLAELGVEPFDLVVVNLYPFRETVASGASPDECVEQIDIGGPSMVRAAAKNHPSVAVVTSPARYADVLAAVKDGGFDLTARKRLAAEAFRHTAEYDIAVSSWFASVYAPADDSPFPGFIAAALERKSTLRYGENPHQPAALYVDGTGTGLAEAEQLHGKEMSYNNYTDTDAARRAAYDHDEPCVAIIKHANPCGIAVGSDVAEAHRKAHACDPLSAFGGVITVNRPVARSWRNRSRRSSRGHRRARLRGRRPRSPRQEEEHPRPEGPGRALAPRRGQAHRRRCAPPGDGPSPGGRRRPGQLDPGDGRGTVRGRARGTRLRLEGVPRGQVQRHPARQGRRLGRRRHGPGQPRRLGEAGGRAGRGGAGARCVRGLGRVLPVPGRAGDPHGGRRQGGCAARRFDARRARGRGGAEGGRHHVLHGDAALLPLSPASSAERHVLRPTGIRSGGPRAFS